MNTKFFILLATLMAFAGSLLAGYVQPRPVEIDMANGFAHGDMLSARNSANDSEFIGCGVRHFEDGAGGVVYYGFCQAQVLELEPVTCFTWNKALLDGIQSIADNSYVTFSWTDDGAGALTCTRIGSSTQSFYLPKDKPNF